MTVRTRFAPSPTGRLHLGNARVAVFNWLFTRHHDGDFVLRLEDTDVERNVEGSEESIFHDLRWLGLDWDEGPDVGGEHGPYRQSERTDLYREAAGSLVEAGHAYPCYCTDEELAAQAETVGGREVAHYSGRCRGLSDEERSELEREGRVPALRFALPEDLDVIEVKDEVRGDISFPASDFDDFVIVRRDGRPTYNFAVVVDDSHMNITHVLRGAGHISNTPKQALLFDAMGHDRPRFAHLPTVLAPGGGKLSKRQGGSSIDDLRRAGYHAEGVVNYISLLGWSPADEREVLAREELVEAMDMDRLGASDTTYDPEKMRWLSGQHLAKMDLIALADAAADFVDTDVFPLEGERLVAALMALRSRMQTLGELKDHLREFVYPEESPALDAVRKEVREDEEARRVLETLAREAQGVEAWTPEHLGSAVRRVGEEASVKGASLYHPLRLALTGSPSGPDVGAVMAALGRKETLRRIARTLGEP